MSRPDPDIITMLARLRDQLAATGTAIRATPHGSPEWLDHQHRYRDELYAHIMALEWVLERRSTLPVVEAVGRTGKETS